MRPRIEDVLGTVVLVLVVGRTTHEAVDEAVRYEYSCKVQYSVKNSTVVEVPSRTRRRPSHSTGSTLRRPLMLLRTLSQVEPLLVPYGTAKTETPSHSLYPSGSLSPAKHPLLYRKPTKPYPDCPDALYRKYLPALPPLCSAGSSLNVGISPSTQVSLLYRKHVLHSVHSTPRY